MGSKGKEKDVRPKTLVTRLKKIWLEPPHEGDISLGEMLKILFIFGVCSYVVIFPITKYKNHGAFMHLMWADPSPYLGVSKLHRILTSH